MTEQVQFWSGSWWRFDRYEIRAGAIRPAADASLEQYDPWDLYRISEMKTRTPRPYESLLQLLQSMGATFDEYEWWKLEKCFQDGSLTPSDQDAILHWCSRFGLLGILLLDVKRIEQPRGRVRIRGDNWRVIERRQFTDPAAIRFSRMNGEWIPEMAFPVRESSPPWRTPHVYTRNMDVRAVEDILCFFPDFVKEGNDFEVPFPHSESFWRIYSEPVDDFLSSAMVLLNGVHSVTTSKPEDLPDFLRVQRFPGMRSLLGAADMSLSTDSQGKVQERWICDCLLSTFARMAFQDSLAGMRMLRCYCCGTPFVTSRYQSRYCSLSCAWRQRKRKARAPRNEQSTTGTRSIGRKSEPEPPRVQLRRSRRKLPNA